MVFSPAPTDEQCLAAVEAKNSQATLAAAAASIGITAPALKHRVKLAAERGLLGTKPVLPGFRISQTTAVTNQDGDVVREFIQQRPELGETFEVPAGHAVKGVSALVDADGRTIQQWVKTSHDRAQQDAAIRAVVDGFKDELSRSELVRRPEVALDDKCNQYTVTDYHFGMMAWGEETGGADWDLKLQERLWCDWWAYAIALAPDADTAIFAQLGDLVHFDGLKAITPAHGHVLDSDSRFSKIVRTVIRCCRFAVRELLKKHPHVHLIFSDANHDEAGEVWMRELFAAHFEDEPRVTVDRSPGSFNAFEWGLTSLFYHHGHKKKFKDVDTTWVGRFREVFGRTKFSYGHTGHLHSDEMFTSNTGVRVERHETLAAPSTYEANAGYNSGRSAKVITYSKRFGECGRFTITPEMVQQ
jgi:hypothetical protein